MKRNKMIVGIGLLLIGVFALYGFAAAQNEAQFLWEYDIPGQPYDVAIDSAGDVYVTDTENSCIKKFSSGGTLMATWEYYVKNAEQTFFANPRDIMLDSADNIYVTQNNGLILKLTEPTGGGDLAYSAEHNVAGQYAPCGISGDSGGNVYVTTTNIAGSSYDGTILIFDSGLSAFSTLGTFTYPLYDIAFDSYGTLYVAEGGNSDIIWKYDNEVWTSWLNGFSEPDGVAFDLADNLYVADTQNNCIKIFDSNGDPITTWCGWDSTGGGENDQFFATPSGISVDSSGIYVADLGNDRIVKFAPLCNETGDLIDLIDAVDALNLQKGIDNSLDAKLQNAVDSLNAANADQRQDAVNKLGAFINAVEAQTGEGKPLTEEEANSLIADANFIINCLQQ